MFFYSLTSLTPESSGGQALQSNLANALAIFARNMQQATQLESDLAHGCPGAGAKLFSATIGRRSFHTNVKTASSAKNVAQEQNYCRCRP
jgi:hypothetical protein